MLILFGVGHKNLAIDISDAKRAVTCRKVWVDKAVGINLMKILVEGVNCDRWPRPVLHLYKWRD